MIHDQKNTRVDLGTINYGGLWGDQGRVGLAALS